jgi:hypothetical protein
MRHIVATLRVSQQFLIHTDATTCLYDAIDEPCGPEVAV